MLKIKRTDRGYWTPAQTYENRAINLAGEVAVNKKSAVLALVLGLVLTFTVSLSGWYSESMQKGLADQVIRFHVRANSDTEADQQLKTFVKDSVLARFRPELEQAGSLEQTRAFLTENLDVIAAYATGVVADKGYDYKVAAAITTDYFPTKAYGDVKLPAGRYETLRIDIGDAEGENWWCVMFPPLCYVDVSVKEIPALEKVRLKSILTDDEYALITGDSRDVMIKFKIVEIWQKIKSDSELYFAIRDQSEK